ncbi:uncharacterized protein LOC116852941 [Odontomachus brunneus]|uniref:uncharacterized protein LOC116852941 n=1 Tax=Odontomachus brunneus TaxID=486640 RepID=UPI0013F194AF|nr:uncharacterized protein LOC116852941 [Odontomachus brunneus]
MKDEDNVNDPRVLAVLAMINLNPHISSRELQRNLEIPYVTVRRILQRHKFHPYHITLTQDYVLFSDENSFHNNGQLNRHKYIYWSTYNPHWTQRVDNQHR